MKPIINPSRRVISAAFFAALCATSQAAVIPVIEGVYDAGGASYDAQITTSLITTGQASLAGVTGSASSLGENGFTVAGLNNGSAANADHSTLTFYTEASNIPATIPATITFTLSSLYDITSVRSVAGWTDSFFGAQQFQLLMESNNSGTFTIYGTYIASPDPLVNGEDTFSTRITLTDSTGFLATNVSAVRFLFIDPYPAYPSNGSVIRELSVDGTLSVPEPASLGILAMALVPVISRRRR